MWARCVSACIGQKLWSAEGLRAFCPKPRQQVVGRPGCAIKGYPRNKHSIFNIHRSFITQSSYHINIIIITFKFTLRVNSCTYPCTINYCCVLYFVFCVLLLLLKSSAFLIRFLGKDLVINAWITGDTHCITQGFASSPMQMSTYRYCFF